MSTINEIQKIWDNDVVNQGRNLFSVNLLDYIEDDELINYLDGDGDIYSYIGGIYKEIEENKYELTGFEVQHYEAKVMIDGSDSIFEPNYDRPRDILDNALSLLFERFIDEAIENTKEDMENSKKQDLEDTNSMDINR